MPFRSRSFHQTKTDILIGILSLVLHIILGLAFFYCLSLTNFYLRFINRTLATTLLTFAAMSLAMPPVAITLAPGQPISRRISFTR